MTLRVVPLPEVFAPGKRLGRHVEHDESSRAFAVTAYPAWTLVKVLHERVGPVLDQGDVGACTGFALAGALDTWPLYHSGPLQDASGALRLYELGTRLDDIAGTYPPDDTGSSGLAVCKAAKKLGLISSYRHAFGIEQALHALQLGPVITGVNWYEGFDTPVNGRVEIAGQARGGHEFEVVGYDPHRDEVTAINSWGAKWGKHGRFTFSSKTWATLLAEDGDVTVPVRG